MNQIESEVARSPWRQMQTGVVLLIVAVIAAVLIRTFEDQLRLGRLLGLVFAGGGLGLLFVVLAAIRIILDAWRRRDMRRLGLVVGVIVAVAVTGVLTTNWLTGTAPPGDDFVALIGKSRDDPMVVKIISSMGSAKHSAMAMKDRREFEWPAHDVTMKFDESSKLVRVLLGGLGYNDKYRGTYPFGLVPTDNAESMIGKLGPHDQGDETSGDWFVYSRLGAQIQMKIDRVGAFELFEPVKKTQ